MILLFAGWGAAVALVGGLIGYLWLASDSIEAELKEQRPQITVEVKPKGLEMEQVASTTQKERKILENAPLEKINAVERKQSGQDLEETAQLNQGHQGSDATTGDAKVGVKLHPHPDPKLIEETDQGPLPKMDEDGRQPWHVYSRPFENKGARPRIVIVVTHLGLAPQQTQDAIAKLPSEVTLGFAPYARNLDIWVQQARDNGHEVLIGLPMEPNDYPRNDPGPNGLMLAHSQEENIKRLNWVLSRATGYVGIFDIMGSRFTAEKGSLKPIIQQLNNRGLMILNTRISPNSMMREAAQEIGIPYSAVDITPDLEPSRGGIDRKLGKLLELAMTQKQAVAIMRPLPITMLRLKRWIDRLDPGKVILAPLSAVAEPVKALKQPKS